MRQTLEYKIKLLKFGFPNDSVKFFSAHSQFQMKACTKANNEHF